MASAAKPNHKPTDHARNYSQIAYEFALDASKDRYGRKHCKWVRLAAKRHLSDLKKQRRKAFGHTFDEWHGNDVCDFAEKMPHIEGEWDSPTIHLEPAQVFILVCVFGWRSKAHGGRRFTHAYIEMARKGAKSTITAVVCHYCLTCEGSLGPQVIIGATTAEQAMKVFNPARKMAEQTADYREAFGVQVWARSITCESSGGFMQTMHAKAQTQDGWNPQMCVLDELHAHKDRGLYDVMRSSFGARKAPLFWIITTAGFNIAGVCYEQHRLVKQILDGVVVADHFFGVIFALDDKDDELDESKWIKANPLLGVTPSLEALRAHAIEAKSSPASMGEFRTKHCNRWGGAGEGLINMVNWDRCPKSPIDDELEERLATEPCFGGLDLASTDDITAFVLLWLIDGVLVPKLWFWLPEETIKPRTERANVPYETWHEQGFLRSTPGEVTDYDQVEKVVDEALQTYDVREIGYDGYNAQQLITHLLDKDAPMVQLTQSYATYNAPIREMWRRLKSRRFRTCGNPVLKWMASNLVGIQGDTGAWRPSKKRSPEKIDGMVALYMALNRMLLDEGEGGYIEEGLVVFGDEDDD